MPKVREYYIAADQVFWNYLPSGRNAATGSSTLPAAGQPYFERGTEQDRIGSQYHKAKYRAYTDKTFDEPMAEDPLLGILGPTMYVQVGDTLKIYFKNNLPYPTNLQARGVARPNAGAPFDDYLVQPGEIRVYEWEVTEEAGPQGVHDGCVAWLYYPDIGAVANWQSGLVGTIVVTTLNAAGRPIDIDGTYPLFFAVFDENLSPFIDISGEDALGVLWNPALKNDTAFRESNRMAAVNGYAYGNLPPLPTHKNQFVQLYLATMAEGDPIERIAVHLHGAPLHLLGHRVTSVQLVPANVWVTEAKPQQKGTFLIRTMTANLTDRGMFAFVSIV